MKRLHWIVLTEVIALFVGSSPAWSESKPETKAEDNFKVSWSSVTYNKTVSLHNPAGSSGTQGPQASESLSLNCEVEILDPNLVMGTCREPIVQEITNGKGRDIRTALMSSGPNRMQYEALRYRRRFTIPPKPARWKTAVRSVLRLSPKESSRPQLVTELEPCRIRIRLDVGLCELTDGEIDRVKGHFYVLIAESFEYVELPFEPNDNWVRLTPDLEIQIRDAWCKESSYRLSTKVRPQGGTYSRPLYRESDLPTRIVVGRDMIDQDGKPLRNSVGINRLPFYVAGSHSGSGGFKGTIKKVRYKIAVNPTHQEIPFILEDIPLPKP